MKAMEKGTPTLAGQSSYHELRRSRRTLRLLARLIQWGSLALGFVLFLDQSRALLSDAQFTWGERQIMGLTALVALGGCGFAGWVVARLIAVAAELLDVLADCAEAARHSTELIERHVVPTLARIAASLEEPRAASGPRATLRERT